MTREKLLEKPRYVYQVAEFLGADRRTIIAALYIRGIDIRNRRLLFPCEIMQILDELQR